MSVLAARLDDTGGGEIRTATGARQSGDSAVSGGGTTASFAYLRDRSVSYTQATLDYTDTIPAHLEPLVWGGTPESSTPGTVDRTAGTYIIFSIPAQGGMGTLYAVEQAQWDAVAEAYDVLGLEVLRQFAWTRYQPRKPGCISFPGDPIVELLAGVGLNGWAGDGGDPKLARIDTPVAIARHPITRDWYIGSSGAVRRISNGVITTVAGTGASGHTGDGPATSQKIGTITGIDFDTAGTMWITDMCPGLAGTLQGGGWTPPPAFPFVTSAVVYAATMVATTPLDGSHITHLVRDVLQTVAHYTPTPANAAYDSLRRVNLGANTLATSLHTFTLPGVTLDDGGNPISWGLAAGASVLVQPDGTLLVSTGYANTLYTPGQPNSVQSNHAIVAVNPASTGTGMLAGQIQSHVGITTYTLGTTNNPANLPQQMAFGPDGSLYWADAGYNCIRKRTPSGTFSVVYGDPTDPFGDSDLTHANKPQGVGLDAAGNIFIADTDNGRILRIDAVTAEVKLIMGGPTATNIGPGFKASETRVVKPTRIYVGPCGQLTVVDTAVDRVYQMGCKC